MYADVSNTPLTEEDRLHIHLLRSINFIIANGSQPGGLKGFQNHMVRLSEIYADDYPHIARNLDVLSDHPGDVVELVRIWR